MTVAGQGRGCETTRDEAGGTGTLVGCEDQVEKVDQVKLPASLHIGQHKMKDQRSKTNDENRGLDLSNSLFQSISNSTSNPDSAVQNSSNDNTPTPHAHSQGAPDTVSAVISSEVSCSVTGPGATWATTSAGGTARTCWAAPGRAAAARKGEVENGRRSVAGECEGRRERRVKRDMAARGCPGDERKTR